MSKQFEYYGNHVYGDGEAPPLINQEPDKVYCPECGDELESENELKRYHSIFLNRTIIACVKCYQDEDESTKNPTL